MGESPETMRKLCLSTKFPHQEISWNYGIFRSVKQGDSLNNQKQNVCVLQQILQ